METHVPVVDEDAQAVAEARRRAFTAQYKRRILKEAAACTTPGAVGPLLRREGLYSSHLVEWRRARTRGDIAGPAPKRRGRKPTPVDPRDRRIAELARQLAEMTGRPERAEVLRAVYALHPERFPRDVPVPPPLPTAAWINQPPPTAPLAVPEGAGS